MKFDFDARDCRFKSVAGDGDSWRKESFASVAVFGVGWSDTAIGAFGWREIATKLAYVSFRFHGINRFVDAFS